MVARFLLLIVTMLAPTAAAGDVFAQVAQPEQAAAPTLKPRGAETRPNEAKADGWSSATTTIGALALVLGVFFIVVWLLRQHSPSALGGLPAEVFEVLGRGRLDARHPVQLVRCGGKLLLVSLGATGATALAEITDPAEVQRLDELCRQNRSGGFGLRRAANRREGRDE